MAKKMKMSINFDFKKFLLEKGERVGVGVAAGFAALLLLLGVWTGMGKTSPLPKLKANAEKLNRDVQGATVPDGIEKPNLPIEATREEPDPDATPVWELAMRVNMKDNKKHNPQVVGMVPGKGWKPSYQVQFLRVPVRQVEYSLGEEVSVIVAKKEKPGPDQKYPYAEIMAPTRMVIVSANFNHEEQLKAFAEALRAKSVKDLKQRPQFLGYYLYRRTTLPDGKVKTHQEYPTADGKPGEWEPLVGADKKGPFHKLLSASPDVVPEASTQKDYMLPGLVMPRPALAPGFSYPPLTGLAGIPDAREEPAKGQVVKSNPKAGENQQKAPLKWDDLKEDERKRLSGESVDILNLTNPFKVEKNKAPIPFTKKIGVLRFIDPNVKPGHTYDYSFVVRLANPNLDKDNEVAALKFARAKELLSNYNFVTNVKIPYDVKFYAVDEKALDPTGYKKETAMPGAEWRVARAHEGEVALQIHRWVDESKSQPDDKVHKLGEWFVAERLLVRRGEFLGWESPVEVPKWDEVAKEYRMARFAQPKKRARPARKGAPTPKGLGLNIDFTVVTDLRLPPAILVDFDGGRQLALVDPKKPSVPDESAEELLVLTPEGKLVVRDGRKDVDPDTAVGKERLERYEAWKKRILALRSTIKKGDKDPDDRRGAFEERKPANE